MHYMVHIPSWMERYAHTYIHNLFPLFVIARDRHIAKFSRLLVAGTTQAPEDRSSAVNKNRWLVNLSSKTLTDAEQTVLQKGLNFAHAPRKMPTFEIAAAIKGVACEMNGHDVSKLCGSVCSVLKRSKAPPSNITKEERLALVP